MQPYVIRRALGATLVACSAVSAQQTNSGYTGFVGAGISATASGALSDRLAANGYPAFGTTPFGIGVGGYRRFASGLLLGGEWHYLAIGDGEHEGRDVGLGGGYATLGVGYAFEPTPRTRIYPRLGLGVGGMGLWSEETGGGGSVSFDDWLASPQADPEYTTLSQASMAVDLGAGAEVALRGRLSGPILAVRVGYVATPFDQGWTRDGTRVTGSPGATVAGPYLRAMIGWRRERQ